MAGRCVLLLACCVVVGVAADAKPKRAPIAPMDIVHGTVEVLNDLYGAVYDAVEGVATKHGLPAKAKSTINNIVTEDPIGFACSKIGCKKAEIDAHVSKAQSTVQQVKAQAYEYVAKATDFLHDFADKVVAKIEQLVPSFKGRLAKNFWDLLLLTLYALFVAYVVFFIGCWVFSTALAIFCCVFCCGCCRSKASPDAKNGKNAASKKAAAAAKGTAKASPKKK